MDLSPLLQNLNEPQREAVRTTTGPVLIIAGAGSGKTRVITHRIAWLIAEEGVAPGEILAATFTNKAAREMKHRINALCGDVGAAGLAIATFHSHCARFLRYEAGAVGLTDRYTICDDKDQVAVLRDCITTLGLNPKHLAPGDVQEVISLAKMKLLENEPACEFIEKFRDAKYADVYSLYQKRLRQSDAVDFDDLLLLMVRLWREQPDVLRRYQERFRHILVDEYQDTNLAQFEIVRMLAGEHHNLCVVGDEDQSIYSWRGAEISNLLDFQKTFPEARIIRLEQNYRSTANILDAAGAVIDHNSQRLGKQLWTSGDRGDPLVLVEASSEQDEALRVATEIERLHAQGVPLQEIAVFYRVNALSRACEDALRQADIPYQVIGGLRFYDRAEIKDVLAYLQVIANPGNTIALLRIINTPRRGLGNVALSRLIAHAESSGVTLFEVLMEPDRVAEAGVRGKAAKAANEFARAVIAWNADAHTLTLRKLAEKVLKDIDYETSLGDPRSIEVLSRMENLREFLGALEQFEDSEPDATLDDYLEAVALRANDDEENAAPGVSLMTVHNAKGLEFDVVFVIALEKKLFPNARALRDQGHAEEERRLFYVALTRARKRAYLSCAQTRRLYGQMEWNMPSVFLYEIPEELRVQHSEADLAPLSAGRRDAAAAPGAPVGPQPDKPPLEHRSLKRQPARSGGGEKQRFAHETLGEVEIVSEAGKGPHKRLTVRTRSGTEHTLLARYAHLTPITSSASPDVEKKASRPDREPSVSPRPTEDDDPLPF